MGTHEINDTLYVTSCCSCGIRFGIPNSYDDALRRNGESFHCPNGHKLTYSSGKNLEEWNKLAKEQEKEIKTLRTKLDQKTHHLDQLGAQLNVPVMENEDREKKPAVEGKPAVEEKPAGEEGA